MMADPRTLAQQQQEELEARLRAEEAEFDAYPPGGWADETYEEDE